MYTNKLLPGQSPPGVFCSYTPLPTCSIYCMAAEGNAGFSQFDSLRVWAPCFAKHLAVAVGLWSRPCNRPVDSIQLRVMSIFPKQRRLKQLHDISIHTGQDVLAHDDMTIFLLLHCGNGILLGPRMPPVSMIAQFAAWTPQSGNCVTNGQRSMKPVEGR